MLRCLRIQSRPVLRLADSLGGGATAVSRGFSLVELLLVISLIAILAALLLPALARARQHAMGAQCLSNCRQCAAAALTYEIDFGRLPMHVAESGTSNLAHAVKSSGFDARTQYEPYMNVDYFRCPFLPAWRPSQASAENVHVNYVLPPGYFADYDQEQWSTQRWVRSDRPWTVDDRPLRVLVMDRNYRFHNVAMGLQTNIINHGDGRFFVQDVDTPINRGVARVSHSPDDLRRDHDLNAAFTDGSARAFSGAADVMVRVPDRDPTKDGSYLMPSF